MECLILRTEPEGESDALVVTLTAEGRKREGLARSARMMRSRLRAGIQPLSLSDLTFVAGKQRWHVRSAMPLMTFPAFRSSLPALTSARAVASLLAEATTDTPDPTLYAHATRIFRDLHTIAEGHAPAFTLARQFLAAMLKTFELVGFAPTIDRCGNCGAQTMLAALSPSGGGILCGPCASTIPDSRALSPDAIEALRNRRVPFGRGDVREILRFIVSFAGFHAPAARGEIRIAALIVFPENPQRKLSREGANV